MDSTGLTRPAFQARAVQHRSMDAQAVPFDPMAQTVLFANALNASSVSRRFAEAQGVPIQAEGAPLVANAAHVRTVVRGYMEAVL